MAKPLDAEAIPKHASPLQHQKRHETQPYGHLIRLPIALAESACMVRRRKPESTARRHDRSARSVQETPLAGGRADLRPAAPAFRQALRGTEQTGGRDRGARPTPRRSQHRDGARRRRGDPDPPSAERSRAGARASVTVAPRARDHSQGSTHDGTQRCRARQSGVVDMPLSEWSEMHGVRVAANT
jgi:hypothetical protein